jgi:hypothetical protein
MMKVVKTLSHSFGFRPGIDLNKPNQLVDELEAATYAASQSSRSRMRRKKRHDPVRRQREAKQNEAL